MSNVLSFAEESVWDGEKFRSIRREVVFIVSGHAIKTGVAIRHEFRADYGLFYDYEDTILLHILSEEIPDVEWGWFVYWKRMDSSTISILNPETNAIVGSIFTRGRKKQKLSGEILAANVVPISLAGEYRERRIAREAQRAAKRDGREDSPED